MYPLFNLNLFQFDESIKPLGMTFLFWVISQKCSEITDFKDFEETFRNECSERNERRGTVVLRSAPQRGPRIALDDGAPKRMERAE